MAETAQAGRTSRSLNHKGMPPHSRDALNNKDPAANAPTGPLQAPPGTPPPGVQSRNAEFIYVLYFFLEAYRCF